MSVAEACRKLIVKKFTRYTLQGGDWFEVGKNEPEVSFGAA